jgi:hypothetical protein
VVPDVMGQPCRCAIFLLLSFSLSLSVAINDRA